MSTYFYLLIRKDIPLADQICQVAHAAQIAGRDFRHQDGCNLVLLGVDNKEDLLGIIPKLQENGIQFAVHIEPDDDMGETAICTQPIEQHQRKVFRKYKLWDLM